MAPAIVQSTEILTLIGAGPVPELVLTESLARSAGVVAADGGASTALQRGLVPRAVIGDFDSLDHRVRQSIPTEHLHFIADQDTTDFEKALAHIDAPLLLAIGFTGRRLDHELAVYNALVRISDRPAIVLGEEDICFALSRPLKLSLPIGSRVSLFPMAEVRCASDGLRWATDHLVFSPWGRVGTSNETDAPEVQLTPGGPGMMVILSRAHLDAAITALLS